MKFRVALALALFLNLLMHPLLHAADTQLFGSPTQQAAFSSHDAQGRPDCEFCHLAGSAQVETSIGTLTKADFTSSDLFTSPDPIVPRADRATQPSRAPPAA